MIAAGTGNEDGNDTVLILRMMVKVMMIMVMMMLVGLMLVMLLMMHSALPKVFGVDW